MDILTSLFSALALFMVWVTMGKGWKLPLFVSLVFWVLLFSAPLYGFGLLGLLIVILMVRLDSVRNASSGGRIQYTYSIYGDNQFSGYTIQKGASSRHLNPGSHLIPLSMRQAVTQAMYIPTYSNGDVVVAVSVEEDGSIFDHVVTAEQIYRRTTDGMWDEPGDYETHIDRVNTHGHQAVVPGDGKIVLPAPTGMAAKFMSQFNGPNITKVRRR